MYVICTVHGVIKEGNSQKLGEGILNWERGQKDFNMILKSSFRRVTASLNVAVHEKTALLKHKHECIFALLNKRKNATRSKKNEPCVRLRSCSHLSAFVCVPLQIF